MDDDRDANHPPIKKRLGEEIIVLQNVKKYYHLKGGEEVKAIDGIDLNYDSEYYPIRRGEFVMLRGPSGGGRCVVVKDAVVVKLLNIDVAEDILILLGMLLRMLMLFFSSLFASLLCLSLLPGVGKNFTAKTLLSSFIFVL